MDTGLAFALGASAFAGAVLIANAIGYAWEYGRGRRPPDRPATAALAEFVKNRHAEQQRKAAETQETGYRQKLLLPLDGTAPTQNGPQAEQIEIPVPLNCPEGNWCSWNLESDLVRITRTGEFAKEIGNLARLLSETFRPGRDFIEICLHRERYGGERAIGVKAAVRTQGDARTFKLGYLDPNAVAWVSGKFDNEMPIAAQLVRMSREGKRYTMKVACLMPPKTERAQYEL
ncbi:hypothetical protein [Mangrovicoccus ximenensis]|uniref:hypothetical protein n=1 Tax=Mangrovicoccus ximenensis TaxID=1911570 RepID=UPI000D389C49|nr:hypothetical protein [Mangrovicoccus ximenensis]